MLEHAGGQQLREGASVMTVGLVFGVRDRLKLVGVDDQHLGDVRADDPRDRQRVSGGLQSDAVIRVKLLHEFEQRSGSGTDPWPVLNLRIDHRGDFTEVSVHV